MNGPEALPRVITVPVDVYRVEGPDGQGPYATMHARKHLSFGRNQPAPFDDGMRHWQRVFNDMRSEDYARHGLFGFASLTDLRFWFERDELEALDREGFSKVKYRSRFTVLGRHQVVFDRTQAERLASLPLIQILQQQKENA
jgi:hypothetical protein